MKTSTFVIAALFASVQATESACHASGIAGVTCGPSDFELFATGMNGDEDLGEDITMKGDKFHFIQNENVQLDAEPAAKGSGTGIVYSTAGYSEPDKVHTLDPKITKAHSTFSLAEGKPADTGIVYSTVGYSEPDKVSTFDPKITKAHTTFSLSQAEPAANATATATAGAKTSYPEPEKVHTLDPKIAKAHTTFYGKQLSQAEPATEAPVAAKAHSTFSLAEGKPADTGIVYSTVGYSEPDKVHTLDPKITKAHTTFSLSQAEPAANATATAGAKAAYPEPEKVHTLDPKIAKAHTTFYGKQLSQAEPATEAPVAAKADYPAPEKVHTLDPKIAKAHTTFYNQQKGALIEINGIPKNENKDTFTGVKDFPYPGPEQVNTHESKIVGGLTTYYNKK